MKHNKTKTRTIASLILSVGLALVFFAAVDRISTPPATKAPASEPAIEDIPNLVGKTREEAEEILESLGYTVVYYYDYD